MSLGNIIRERRRQLKLTLDQVSAKIGYSKPYLSTIETGKARNAPSDELLTKLERVLEFEAGLLLRYAHIDMMPEQVRKDICLQQEENRKLRSLFKDIVEARNDPQSLAALIADSNLRLEKESFNFNDARLIPVINRVPAGAMMDFDDLGYPVGVADDYIRCPEVNDANAFALRVTGDSMEPDFSDGNTVVFSPALEVRSGDDCFVRLSHPHEVAFKRVFFEDEGRVRLQPRNEQYKPIIVEPDRITGICRAIIKYQKL